MQKKLDKLITDLRYLWETESNFELLMEVIEARKETFPKKYSMRDHHGVPDGFYIVLDPDFPYVILKRKRQWYVESLINVPPDFPFYGPLTLPKRYKREASQL